MRRILVLIASMAVLLLPGPVAMAHVGEAVVIDSALCTVKPRTVEELIALLPIGTPVPPSDPTSTTAFVPPAGDAIDAKAAAAVEAFVYEVSACLQRGDLLATFALQTDAYIARTFARRGFTEEQLRSLVQPQPASEGTTTTLTINDMRVLKDKRVGVLVAEELSQGGMVQNAGYYYYLVEEQGHYLIDDYVLVSTS